MEKYIINIDTKQTREKPRTGSCEFGLISNRVAEHIEELSLEKIIDEVGNKGKAFCRALLIGGQRKEENFQRQIFLVLDFDSNPDYEAFKRKCREYNLQYTFTYRTLSWKKEDQRFRAIFVLDEWIENKQTAKAANYLLLKLFDEDSGTLADQNCKDLPRIFLGGKKIIEQNPEARVSIMDIVYAFHDYYRKVKGSNYQARLKTVAKDIGVKIIDGALGIYEPSMISENIQDQDMIKESNVVLILPDCKEDVIKRPVYKEDVNKGQQELRIIPGVSLETLKEMCPLFSDYVEEKRDLSHGEKFFLATNLRYFKGGKQWFFDHLKEHKSKWKKDWDGYIVNYLPARCDTCQCPHINDCHCTSLYQNAGRRIRMLSNVNRYFDADDCVEQLNKCLERAVDEPGDGIHIIKAQTALGKTEAYCSLIQKRSDKKFLIAVPTCRLQDEIVERLQYKGVECAKTESIYTKVKKLGLPDLEEKIERLYEKGYGRFVVKEIRQYKNQNREELTKNQKQELDKLTGRKKELEQVRCIVTTHAFLLMMGTEKLQDYNIIIDEDILLTLFKENWSMPLADIELAVEEQILSKKNTSILKDILKMQDQEAKQVEFAQLNDVQLDNLYKEGISFDGPLPKLLESSFVVMDSLHQEILFSKKITLPPGKLIVLSATADDKLYEDVAGEERQIYFQPIYNAKYKGKVIQYTGHTMSRKCIKMVGEEEVFRKVKEIAGDIPIITFKMLDAKMDIHFGKTEGFDSYKGQDIAIVGTPHNRPAFYKLIGAALGYHTDGKITNHRIKRNNYSFPIMTFSNTDMQNLQLFFIESELEQAIGRSRVLREDCTVYVFSNYPCQQAELIEKPYLDFQNEDEMDDVEE